MTIINNDKQQLCTITALMIITIINIVKCAGMYCVFLYVVLYIYFVHITNGKVHIYYNPKMNMENTFQESID